MEYIKFKTSSDISNFTPETGCAVLFAEEASGNISLKAKLSDGNIVSVLNQADQQTIDSSRLLPENMQDGDLVMWSDSVSGVNYNDENSVYLLQGSLENTAMGNNSIKATPITTGTPAVQSDGSVLFVDSSQYLTFGDADTKRVFGSDFTIDLIIKTTQFNTTSRIDANFFALYGGSSSSYTYLSCYQTSAAGLYGVWVYNTQSGANFQKTAQNNIKQHIAIDVWMDGDTRKYATYINGVLANSGNWNEPNPSSSSGTTSMKFFGQSDNQSLTNAYVYSMRISNKARYKGVGFSAPIDGYIAKPAGMPIRLTIADLKQKLDAITT